VFVKRPWLLTQDGQRTSLWIANVLSVIALVALWIQLSFVEAPRQNVSQIDRSNLSECLLEECGRISELGGLEPESMKVTQGEFVNTIRIEFVNHGRLVGEREIWLELRNQSGRWLEAGRTKLELSPKGKTFVEFGFVQNVSAIEAGVLKLQY
jgi:hypothetical protein